MSTVLYAVTLLALAGCTPSSVTGVVQEVGERYSYSSNGRVGESGRFISVVIVAADGIEHRTALPIQFEQTHEIRPGDVLTVELGRTAYRSIIGEHAVKEKDGTVRIVESKNVGWRLIEKYKIVQSAQK